MNGIFLLVNTTAISIHVDQSNLKFAWGGGVKWRRRERGRVSRGCSWLLTKEDNFTITTHSLKSLRGSLTHDTPVRVSVDNK